MNKIFAVAISVSVLVFNSTAFADTKTKALSSQGSAILTKEIGTDHSILRVGGDAAKALYVETLKAVVPVLSSTNAGHVELEVKVKVGKNIRCTLEAESGDYQCEMIFESNSGQLVDLKARRDAAQKLRLEELE